MSYVLANSKVSVTFDDDAATGLKLTSFKRAGAGSHAWPNTQTKLFVARCYDTTTAPATATADFVPTMATRGPVSIVPDAGGKQIVATWTALPIGTDALTVTVTIRLDNGAEGPLFSYAAAWVGTPTRHSLDSIVMLPLAVDPFNQPNDHAFCPALDGIDSEDPIVNLRYDPTGGRPNTPFAGATLECRMWYPAGRQWTMAFWGYWETVSREGWMVCLEPGSLEMVNVLWQSDGARMTFDATQPQPDNVLLANGGRALGSQYKLCLRPFRAAQGRAWWDMARYYRARLEAVKPAWLPDIRTKRTDLSRVEKTVAPFVAIQAVDTLHAVGDGMPGDIGGMIETIRANCGAPAGTQINGSVESPTHNLHLAAEAADSDLRAKLAAIHAGGKTFISMWYPAGGNDGAGGPLTAGSVGIWATPRFHQTLGDQAELRWWKQSDSSGALRMSRKGLIEGGGVDRLMERADGTYFRERAFGVTGWNAAARAVSVNGGSPSASGFPATTYVVLVPQSGNARLAFADVASLGAATVVLAASAPTSGVFHDALGAVVAPQAGDQVVVFDDLGSTSDVCPHAAVNSTAWMTRLLANSTKGVQAAWGACGFYLDVWSEPTVLDQRPYATTCYRDHSTWSKIDAGYARHPCGGGDFWKKSRRDFVKKLRDEARAAQVATGREPFFSMTCEYLDETMLGCFDWRWHPISAGRLFRQTTGCDPAIHKYKTVPAFAVVHSGRYMGRALNEEFSSAIAVASAPFNDATLRRFQGYCLASEWVYGVTWATLSLFVADFVPLVNLWDDTIYVSGGGLVHDDVKRIRDLWCQIVFAETRWITNWLRFGELMPIATLDMGVTDVTTGMADTATWTAFYQTYDTIYDRTAFPRVVHGVWRCNKDGSLCVALANWTDTAGDWKGAIDLTLCGFPADCTVRWRRVDYKNVRVDGGTIAHASTIDLSSIAVPAYTIQAFIIEQIELSA